MNAGNNINKFIVNVSSKAIIISFILSILEVLDAEKLKPTIVKAIPLMIKAGTSTYSIDLTCSIISTLAIPAAMIVLSDKGDNLSPKNEPEDRKRGVKT